MIKQLLCLLLVLSLLIPFASCSDTAPDAVTADESETTAETEPDDTRVYPELPDYDAEGATVTVVNIDYSIPIWAQRDTMSSFYNGCGGIIAAKDENDLPVMFLNTEESFAILDKLYDYLYNEEICFHVMKFFDPKPEGFTNGMTRMFQSNSALFMWIRMADVENLRAMDVDFGILPIPKLNETQNRYYHSVNPYVGATVIVPKSAPDLELTGIFIEAISAESKYILQATYYEVMLTTKLTRDNESLDMLDIIFTSRIYDNGEIYDFGGIGSDLIYMTMTYDRDMASTYAKKEKQIAKEIEKTIKKFTEG